MVAHPCLEINDPAKGIEGGAYYRQFASFSSFFFTLFMV